MINFRLCWLAALAGGILFGSDFSLQAGTPKALVIMLDGTRADVVDAAATPNLHKLIAGQWQPGYHGAYADNARSLSDARPNSAPNHTAIATGVTAAKHKVFNNGQTPNGDYQHYPIFLEYLQRVQPELSTAFFYSWQESGTIKGGSDAIAYHHNSDAENNRQAAEFLKNGGDVALVYIDLPDHGGHGESFYPHSAFYLWSVVQSDRYIGNLLDAISSRPEIAREDWLIVVTADHGGYGPNHGMLGGNAHTIPFLVCSKTIKPGRIAGTPDNLDAAPTVLAHFGLHPADYPFDGTVRGNEIQPETEHALADGLLVYCDFNAESITNAVDNAEMKKTGAYVKSNVKPGKFDGALELPRGDGIAEYVELTGSEAFFADKPEFTVSMWVKMPPEQLGDALLVSNKDWRDGSLPGFALIAAKQAESAARPGIGLNLGLTGRQRVDLAQFDVEPEQWMFLAATLDANQTLQLYQGSSSGTLYFINAPAGQAELVSGMPWNIGQDGTGNYQFNYGGKLDDFALWDRALSKEELRTIFDAGRRGLALGELLNHL